VTLVNDDIGKKPITLSFTYTPSTSEEKQIKKREVLVVGNNDCTKLDKTCVLSVKDKKEDKKEGGRRKRKTKKTRRNRRRSSRRRN